jgi:hypothetical protein
MDTSVRIEFFASPVMLNSPAEFSAWGKSEILAIGGNMASPLEIRRSIVRQSAY